MDSVFLSLDYLEQTLVTLPFAIDLPPSIATATSRRQRSYLAGRACAQVLYQKYGISWDQLLPATGPPTSQRCPQWPKGFVGSISHSHSLAIACLQPVEHCLSVGVDIEEIIQTERMDRLRKRIMHPNEDWVNTPQALSLVFSFKESLYKALYPILNRYIGFQEVQVFPPKMSSYTLCLDWRPEVQLKKELAAHLKPHLYLKPGWGQWLSQPQNRGSVLTRYEIIKGP